MKAHLKISPWVKGVLSLELVMVIFNRHLAMIYIGIALVLLIFGIVALLATRPSEGYPPQVFFCSVFLALGYAYAAFALGVSVWRFLLIFISSGIILPIFLRAFTTVSEDDLRQEEVMEEDKHG